MDAFTDKLPLIGGFAMKRPASLVVGIMLMLMATGQLLRFVLGTTIIVEGITIPLWISAIVAIVLGALAAWLLRERRR